MEPVEITAGRRAAAALASRIRRGRPPSLPGPGHPALDHRSEPVPAGTRARIRHQDEPEAWADGHRGAVRGLRPGHRRAARLLRPDPHRPRRRHRRDRLLDGALGPRSGRGTVRPPGRSPGGRSTRSGCPPASWRAEVGNHASLLVALRAGFRIEGVARRPGRRRARDAWVGATAARRRPTPERPASGCTVPPARRGLRPARSPVLFATTRGGEIRLRAARGARPRRLVAGARDPESVRWTTVPDPYEREDAESFAREYGRRAGRAAPAPFFAIGDPADDAYAGLMELRLWRARPAVADVGFVVAPRGARARATHPPRWSRVCAWGFTALGLTRIEWRANVGNTASRRVAEKAGFTFEGTARAALDHRGERVDAWVAALLAGSRHRGSRGRRMIKQEPIDGVRGAAAPLSPRGRRRRRRRRPARTRSPSGSCRTCPTRTPDEARWWIGEGAPGGLDRRAAPRTRSSTRATDRLLGGVGLGRVEPDGAKGEIGYWVAPWARGARRRHGRGARPDRARVRLPAWPGWNCSPRWRTRPSQRVALARRLRLRGVRRRAAGDRDGSRRDLLAFARLAGDPAGPAARLLPDLPGGAAHRRRGHAAPARARPTPTSAPAAQHTRRRGDDGAAGRARPRGGGAALRPRRVALARPASAPTW